MGLSNKAINGIAGALTPDVVDFIQADERYVQWSLPVGCIPLPNVSESDKLDLAFNRSTPLETLQQLAEDKDVYVRHGVAQNRNTPLETLQQLATDVDPYVRGYVARNSSTSLEILEQLTMDVYYYVRAMTAENPNTPLETLQQLATDDDPYVRYRVTSNPKSTELIRRLVLMFNAKMGIENMYDVI